MTIAINDQSTNDHATLPIDNPQTTKMSYQIGISTDNKTKLESETFGIKDDKLR